MIICVLGRQPELGIAELEAIAGKGNVRRVGRDCAFVDTDKGLSQKGLGGTVKMGELIATFPSIEIRAIAPRLISEVERAIAGPEGGKRVFGLSAYGLRVGRGRLTGLALAVKRKLGSRGISARAVLGKGQELNSAQVMHKGLDGKGGHEFLIVGDGQKTYLAKTVSVQDIDSYSKRDYGRPGRDTKTGMLPPKLAQIMLNLAGAGPGTTVLDPFCGTGVVLMEAALMGCRVEGSDINQRMVDCTRENLSWLSKEYNLRTEVRRLGVADATAHHWGDGIERVVSEIYLGPPLSHNPGRAELDAIVGQCNGIAARFLKNLRPQLGADARCCIAVPAWFHDGRIVHLPVSRVLEGLGYARVRFSHAGPEGLVYRRPGQHVARELLVLMPK
jgi:tRNA (guanine10-N2)-dimethyltransferase